MLTTVIGRSQFTTVTVHPPNDLKFRVVAADSRIGVAKISVGRLRVRESEARYLSRGFASAKIPSDHGARM